MIAKSRRARPAAQAPRAKAAGQSRTADKRQKFPDDRRSIRINEATRLLDSKGYENTSMWDIAAAVGILPGSLYHHFRPRRICSSRSILSRRPNRWMP
jgi:AcrR family transcriptional regulator